MPSDTPDLGGKTPILLPTPFNPAQRTGIRSSSLRGTPLSPRSVQEVVAKYAKASGLKGVSPHTLRHTFGKGLLDAGVSLDKVAKLLGHSSIETTKIYTTPSRADLKEAVERLV